MIFGFVHLATKASFAQATDLKHQSIAPTIPGWKLIFDDEFNHPGLPNPAKWGYEVGFIRNHEAQYYAKARLKNSFVHGGILTIEGRHENYKGGAYSSASLTTQGKFSFTYGRVEMMAKLPQAVGTWPAFWMLGTDIQKVGWPKSGEVDIMEHVGFMPKTIFGTCHMADANGKHYSKGGKIDLADHGAGWHRYMIDWSKSRIDFYVDNDLYFSYVKSASLPWSFSKPMYLILNLAIGGSWGAQKGIDASAFPQKYNVKYVRVYQRG